MTSNITSLTGCLNVGMFCCSSFSTLLTQLGWPVASSAISSQHLDSWNTHQQHFIQLFTSLLKMDSTPDSNIQPDQPDQGEGTNPLPAGGGGTHSFPGGVGPLPDEGEVTHPLPLPLELMVLPLRKRFKYHFTENRKTNNLEKVTHLMLTLNILLVHMYVPCSPHHFHTYVPCSPHHFHTYVPCSPLHFHTYHVPLITFTHTMFPSSLPHIPCSPHHFHTYVCTMFPSSYVRMYHVPLINSICTMFPSSLPYIRMYHVPLITSIHTYVPCSLH